MFKTGLPVLFAAVISSSLPSVAQDALLLASPPRVEFPEDAVTLNRSACCLVGVIAGEAGSIAQSHAVCTDPMFDDAAIRAARSMRFAAQSSRGYSTAGLAYSKTLKFQIEGAAMPACPAPSILNDVMSGRSIQQASGSAAHFTPFQENFAGSCGAAPGLWPSTIDGINRLTRDDINSAGQSWQRYRDWRRCRADQFDRESARLQAHFAGRMVLTGTPEAENYRAASQRFIEEGRWLQERGQFVSDYVRALNARTDRFEAEDREERANRPSRDYSERPRREQTVGEAYIESLSAAPHLRCLEQAYTYAQEQACLNAWFGVQVPQ